MTQLFQDTMAICRHFHKLDLFLTMTANPKWPEIIHSLFPGQTATHRSDIVSRVFEQKKKALQLPDPQLQLLLFAKVTKYMLHGPCGVDNPQAKCMVNGKYSKHFPKEYRERTDWAKDSYLLYARPDNGLVFEHNGARFTNQYVVPYCPQLLLLFDCHLNIEISTRLGTVKYLSKYIYKGPDRATMEISGGM